MARLTATQSRTVIVTIEVDGVDISLLSINGALRVASDGVDVGPVRGRKRLSGPHLALSDKGSRAVYRRLAASVEYRAFLAQERR